MNVQMKKNHIFMNVQAKKNHTFMNVQTEKNHIFMNVQAGSRWAMRRYHFTNPHLRSSFLSQVLVCSLPL